MDISGKLLVLLGLMFVLFAGCIGEAPSDYVTEGETTPVDGTGETTEGTPPVEIGEACEPSYEFSELPETVTMGERVDFSVTSTCAMGKIVGLNIDDKQESGGGITSNEQITFNFIIAPEVEGTKTFTVYSDSESVFEGSLEVKPIGSLDISGTKNDAVSVSEWVAEKFVVETPVKVRSVGAYMRRLYSQTMEHSMVVAQIVSDNAGNPGSTVLAEKQRPITDTTMSDNWLYFNFAEVAELDAGTYWVVFKVSQETQDQIVSDVVNIRYTFDGDTTVPGDASNRQMKLEWDNSQRKFVATSWAPFAYKRTHAVIVSGLEH